MIRAFLPHDFDETVKLIHECGLGHPPNNPELDFERIISAPGSRAFVYEHNGMVKGCVVSANDGRRGWIYYLAVSPEMRGQGVGEALIRHAESWLVAQGVPKVLLLVRHNNLGIMDYYRRLGFTEEPCTCMGRWLCDPA